MCEITFITPFLQLAAEPRTVFLADVMVRRNNRLGRVGDRACPRLARSLIATLHGTTLVFYQQALCICRSHVKLFFRNLRHACIASCRTPFLVAMLLSPQ